MSKRQAYIYTALSKMGASYQWASKGPDTFDCSGLVTWCLKEIGGPDWRGFHNAQRLWNELPATETPQPGDLCLYGRTPAHINHVMVLMPDGRVYGAAGGDSSTKTVAMAKARGARVQHRSKPAYRIDLRGFRSLAQWLD